MANRIPKEFKEDIVDLMELETTWKVALFTSASNCNTNGVYTYTQCATDGHEVTNGAGTAYVTGGNVLTGRISSFVDTTNRKLDADDVTWTKATIAGIRYAVLYNATSPYNIRAVYDLGSDFSVTNGTFTISWNANGILHVI
jgi:hypothetical protein